MILTPLLLVAVDSGDDKKIYILPEDNLSEITNDEKERCFIDFAIYELFEGISVSEYLFDNDNFDNWNSREKNKFIIWFLSKVIEGLKFLSDNNILHRDIKVENILIKPSEKILKIIDLSYCRVIGEPHTFQKINGTNTVMAPEVAEKAPCTVNTDKWSLGAMIFDICHRKPVFAFDNLSLLDKKITPNSPEFTQFQQAIRCFSEIDDKCRMFMNDRELSIYPKEILEILAGFLHLDQESRMSYDAALWRLKKLDVDHRKQYRRFIHQWLIRNVVNPLQKLNCLKAQQRVPAQQTVN